MALIFDETGAWAYVVTSQILTSDKWRDDMPSMECLESLSTTDLRLILQRCECFPAKGRTISQLSELVIKHFHSIKSMTALRAEVTMSKDDLLDRCRELNIMRVLTDKQDKSGKPIAKPARECNIAQLQTAIAAVLAGEVPIVSANAKASSGPRKARKARGACEVADNVWVDSDGEELDDCDRVEAELQAAIRETRQRNAAAAKASTATSSNKPRPPVQKVVEEAEEESDEEAEEAEEEEVEVGADEVSEKEYGQVQAFISDDGDEVLEPVNPIEFLDDGGDLDDLQFFTPNQGDFMAEFRRQRAEFQAGMATTIQRWFRGYLAAAKGKDNDKAS